MSESQREWFEAHRGVLQQVLSGAINAVSVAEDPRPIHGLAAYLRKEAEKFELA